MKNYIHILFLVVLAFAKHSKAHAWEPITDLTVYPGNLSTVSFQASVTIPLEDFEFIQVKVNSDNYRTLSSFELNLLKNGTGPDERVIINSSHIVEGSNTLYLRYSGASRGETFNLTRSEEFIVDVTPPSDINISFNNPQYSSLNYQFNVSSSYGVSKYAWSVDNTTFYNVPSLSPLTRDMITAVRSSMNNVGSHTLYFKAADSSNNWTQNSKAITYRVESSMPPTNVEISPSSVEILYSDDDFSIYVLPNHGVTHYTWTLDPNVWPTSEIAVSTPLTRQVVFGSNSLEKDQYTIYIIGKHSSGGWLHTNSAKQITIRKNLLNSVKTYTFLEETPSNTDNATIDGYARKKRTKSISYTDAMGRPLQSIAIQASNSGKDIVAPVEYDTRGIQSKSLLPYVASNSTGRYKNDALGEEGKQRTYYKGSGYDSSKNIALTNTPYSETVTERSPLNRVIEQASVGEHWKVGSGHTIKTETYTNSSTLTTWNASTGAFDVTFDANQLLITKTTDENGNKSLEYKDKSDKTLIKESQLKKYTTTESLKSFSHTSTAQFTAEKSESVEFTLSINSFHTVRDNPQPATVRIINVTDGTVLHTLSGSGSPNTYQTTAEGLPPHSPTQMSSGEEMQQPSQSSPENNELNKAEEPPSTFFTSNSTAKPLISIVKGNVYKLEVTVVQNTSDNRSWGNISYTRSIYTTAETTPLKLYTHYVYDKFGNLVYIVPPEAVAQLYDSKTSKAIADANGLTAIAKNYVTKFKYDSENRLIEKWTPEAGSVYTLYDKLGRAVMTQDENLRLKKQWLFTKYDIQGRVIYTGIAVKDGSPLALQEILNGNTETTFHESESATDAELGYTRNQSLALLGRSSLNNILSVTYYDSYSNPVTKNLTDRTSDLLSGSSATTYRLKGKVTASKTRILEGGDLLAGTTTFPIQGKTFTYSNNEQIVISNGANDIEILPETTLEVSGTASISLEINGNSNLSEPKFLSAYSVYDNKGRVIKSKSENSVGGYDKILTTYDWAGKVIVSHSIHTDNSGRESKVISTPTYDALNRVAYTTEERFVHGVNKGTRIPSISHYNELGEIYETYIHPTGVSSPDENGNYTFVPTTNNHLYKVIHRKNERGWLTKIHVQDNGGNTLFTEDLAYNENTVGLTGSFHKNYNGNISAVRYTQKYNPSTSKSYRYGYKYDDINQLQNATYQAISNATGDFSTDKLIYDKNGNIKQLWRKKNASHIDKLAYTYSGNQITSISDAVGDDGNVGNDFGADASYTYDKNGNMTHDSGKKIEIKYNHLNLPYQIDFKDHSNNTIQSVQYTYLADGSKIERLKTAPSLYEKTRYAGSYVYEDRNNSTTTLDFINTAGGRFVDDTYEYFTKDHLGNTRQVLRKNSSNYTIDIKQDNHYYAFGLTIEGLSSNTGTKENRYTYNGKEFDTDLNWLHYGARFYDPAVGRWWVKDPIATKAYPSLTPYHYVLNNPVNFADYQGKIVMFVNFGAKAGLGLGLKGDLIVAIDHRGNMAIMKEGGIGAAAGAYAGASISGGFKIFGNGDPLGATVDDLVGQGLTLGGAVGLGIGASADFSVPIELKKGGDIRFKDRNSQAAGILEKLLNSKVKIGGEKGAGAMMYGMITETSFAYNKDGVKSMWSMFNSWTNWYENTFLQWYNDTENNYTNEGSFWKPDELSGGSGVVEVTADR